MPRFDAYSATVYAHEKIALDHVEQAIIDTGERTSRVDGGPVKYYRGITLLVDEHGRKLAAVKYGGPNIHPHVQAEGHTAPAVAEALRAMQCEHRPTRVDSCVDMAAPGLFEQLQGLALEIEQTGVRLNYAGAAVDNPARGTTIYLGSRTSQAFVRIYQKGLQIAEADGIPEYRIPDQLRHWVRIEVEFKPQKRPAKDYAAIVSPRDVWGVSPWTHEFARRALSIDAERVNVNNRRESDHQRAIRYMAQQYRQHLAQLLDDAGGDYAKAMAVLVELAGLERPLAA